MLNSNIFVELLFYYVFKQNCESISGRQLKSVFSVLVTHFISVFLVATGTTEITEIIQWYFNDH